MRVLLDEQLPRQLVPYLVGHEARTVQQQGWAGLKNGDLLKAAEVAGFQSSSPRISSFPINRTWRARRCSSSFSSP